MRLLPLTISALGLVVSLKAVELMTDPAASGLLGSIASAETETAKDSPSLKEEAKAEPKADTKAKSTDDDPLGEAVERPKDILEKNCNFSDIELDILQSLSKRRDEIQAEGAKLQLKENLIRAGEARMERKLAELKQTRQEIDELLKKYGEKEKEKIASLVKIYENMKAKEAARIFEQIDMDILLDVVTAMPERKLAPILAKMSPMRAKEVTQELAERRQLPELQSTAPAAPADPLNAPLPAEMTEPEDEEEAPENEAPAAAPAADAPPPPTDALQETTPEAELPPTN